MGKSVTMFLLTLFAVPVLFAWGAGNVKFAALPVGRVPFADGAVVEDEAYGPVKYWQADAIPVPARATRNILFNGSFEQGLAGWCFASPWAVQSRRYTECIENGGRCYEEIVLDAKFGRRALHLRSLRTGTLYDNVCSETIAVHTNRPYTASFWAKAGRGERPALTFQVGTPVRRTDHGKGIVGKVVWLGNDKPPVVHPVLDEEWRRFEVPFQSNVPGVWLMISGEGAIIDGVMVEEGDKASSPTDDPLVAHLVTASPRVRVFNDYYESVLDRTFALAPTIDESYPLDLSQVGDGVFVVRYDFSFPDGRVWTDYERFGILKPLASDVPVSRFFIHYPFFLTSSSRCADMIQWMEARGIRATSWPEVTSRAKPEIAAIYSGGRFTSGVHTLSHDLKTRYPDRFGWKNGMCAQEFSDLSTNINEHTIAFIEREAYRSGMEAAEGDDTWALDWEEEHERPCIRERLDFEGWQKLVDACHRGLKRAFEERGRNLRFAPTHGLCNFNPPEPAQAGTAKDRRFVFRRMLEEASKTGLKYDVLSVHMYWALDGSIVQRWRRDTMPTLYDRGENAEALVALAAEFGYGDETPIRFEEGGDILPFYLPEYGSEGFADLYGGTYASRAYGNTEFVQAASIARQYIMDLRYWPRLEVSHVWQHRATMDIAMSPWMWTKVSNTIGHLLPDPRFEACGRLTPTSRAYVYRQGSNGVLAVWTHDNDVELGRRHGEILQMRLPPDAHYFDLMGNERIASKHAGGLTAVPLTPAPLFVVSEDIESLCRAVKGER